LTIEEESISMTLRRHRLWRLDMPKKPKTKVKLKDGWVIIPNLGGIKGISIEGEERILMEIDANNHIKIGGPGIWSDVEIWTGGNRRISIPHYGIRSEPHSDFDVLVLNRISKVLELRSLAELGL